MKTKCTNCESQNTSKTHKQYLDSMRDYFCNNCGKDFTPKSEIK